MKALLKNSGILVLSNASLKLINFLLLPLYTNALPPEAYGITDIIINASTLMASIFSLSLDWGMNTYFYEEKDEQYYRKVTSSGMFFFLLSAITCITCTVFSRQISILLFREVDYQFAVTLGIVAASTDLFYFPQRVSTRMRGKLDKVGIISVIKLLLTLTCNIIFILILHLGYISIILSNLIGQACAMLFYTIDSRKYLSPRAVDFSLLKRMLVYSMPITPTLLFNWINSFLDQYFVGHYFSQKEVGLYGIGLRMTGVLSLLTGSFLSAYSSFAYSNAKNEENRMKYSLVLDLLVVGLSSVAVIATLFSREVVQIMTAEAYHHSYIVVGALLFAHIVRVLGLVAGYGITIQKKGILYLSISGAGAIVNIVLNFALVPKYSFLGAAIATFITEIIVFLISFYYSQRLFDCGYDLKKIALCILISFSVSYYFMGAMHKEKILICLCLLLCIGLIYRERIQYLLNTFHKLKQRLRK